jgi:hypothetical protein
VGSVAELGRLTHTPTPNIDAVYALTDLLARSIAANRVAAESLRHAGSQRPAASR